MDKREILATATANIATKIKDTVFHNLGENGLALESPGRFTALLEAYRAVEIAEGLDGDTAAERAQDAEDYRQGVLRNQE